MRRLIATLLAVLALALPQAFAEAQSFLCFDAEGKASQWSSVLPDSQRAALSSVARADEAAAKAKHVYFYASAEPAAYWMFCRTSSDVYHGGTFWYADAARAHYLGRSDEVWGWDYFPGEGLFYSATGAPEAREIHLAALMDGQPVKLDAPEGIVRLGGLNSNHAIYAAADASDYDYCFLTVENGELAELAARPMEPPEFSGLAGAAEFIVELTEQQPDASSVSFLLRSNGVITLNVEYPDGAIAHGYAWAGENGLETLRGWEDEIVLLEGRGSESLNIGLPMAEADE